MNYEMSYEPDHVISIMMLAHDLDHGFYHEDYQNHHEHDYERNYEMDHVRGFVIPVMISAHDHIIILS